MIKELTISIVLGVIVGIVGTSIIKDKIQTSGHKQDQIPLATPSPITSQPTPTENPTHFISISQPKNEIVSSQDKINVQGNTSPNSDIIFHLNSKVSSTISDQNGDFSQQLELESGFNLIQISSFSSTQEQADAELQITYSTANF